MSEQAQTPAGLKVITVIDVGSSSIRMAVAELQADGTIRTLDEVQQAVDLARDSFTTGRISQATTEACVEVIRSFKRLLAEYGVSTFENVHAVATSAVREAANRNAFLDRIEIATGLRVEVISEADINRITYLAVEPLLKADAQVSVDNTFIIEMSGGSTEVLYLQGAHGAHSRTYRLGALRFREMLETYRAPVTQERALLETTIQQTVGQIAQLAPPKAKPFLVGLGGDLRFAAHQLAPDTASHNLVPIKVTKLRNFCEKILNQSVDELVHRYSISFPEAETLGPTLLTMVLLAERLKLKHLHVAPVNFRDSLLNDVLARHPWEGDYRDLIIRSARDLGTKFDVDKSHGLHVAGLAGQLFEALQPEHGLGPRENLLLEVAAMLHEIGMFVTLQSFHKHTFYLLRNSEIFGLNPKDTLMAALVARHHRRGKPRLVAGGYYGLNHAQRMTVMKLSAILRVADALDCTRAQRIRKLKIKLSPGRLTIALSRVDDLTMEEIALQEKGTLFEEVYGRQIILRKGQLDG
jgi:exopolyphosphatase/guanosine-5'-triphosphate,3'-diphosphate pyrophosphatase